MKASICIHVACLMLLFQTGCSTTVCNRAVGHRVHLKTEFGFGAKADVWIYSDDTFSSGQHGVPGGMSYGYSEGLYQRLCNIMDEINGWSISSASLHEAITRSEPPARPLFRFTSGQTPEKIELEFSASNKRYMKAHLKRPYAMKEDYPNVTELQRFFTIVDALHKIHTDKHPENKTDAPSKYE